MNEFTHIVVVDDDPEIRDVLREYLEENGYQVSTADGGTAMRRILAAEKADLVILDLKMPHEDGLTLASFLRKSSDVGIIILTGQGDSADRIAGLELGADDYVSKPCDLRELLARVHSVLRRVKHGAHDEPPGESASLAFAGWSLDLSARRLVSAEEVEVLLTTAEFNLLAALATNANRVLSRDQLLDMTQGRDWSPFDRSLDNLVSRLRHKIEADPKRRP